MIRDSSPLVAILAEEPDAELYTRAAMLFGRAFGHAVAALFRREDAAAVLFEQWGVCKNMGLTYAGNDTWDRLRTAVCSLILCDRIDCQ